MFGGANAVGVALLCRFVRRRFPDHIVHVLLGWLAARTVNEKQSMVTHCICAKRSFADLLSQARAAGWANVADLERATGCGARCGLCRPYLRAVLITGTTSFPPGKCDSRMVVAGNVD
jgi:bacterioferritin-associated ferredoxin